ncbi:hypothetical protein N8940_02495 [Sphingomonadaceae bacterium]|nr:hypothetical protein [Sphingomonadaceae bacterium]
MISRRIFAGIPVTFALALMQGGIASAQDVSADNPLNQRTGRDANQQLPDFADEVEFPSTAIEPPPIAPVSGSVLLSGVEIDDEGAVGAPTIKGWVPQRDDNADLALTHMPGELLGTDWVRRQFADNGLIGSEVSLDRIVTLVQLINRGFIANGYINSGVLVDGAPPENGGALRLRLISGRLTANVAGEPGVSVSFGPTGRNRLSESYILDRMPAASETPLNAVAIEQQFRLLAENPAISTVSADLQPGTRPGEARLALVVDPEPMVDLYFSAANSRSPSIGGERYAVGGSFRNLLRPGDIFSAETGFTGGRQDLIVGYEGPFIGTRSLIRARGGFNRAAVIDPQLRPLDITSRDWQAEGGFAYNLLQRPLTPQTIDGTPGWLAARTVTVGVSLAHRQSDTTLLGRPFSFSPGAVNGRSEYTAMRLTGDFVQRGISTVLAISLTGTQGLDGTQSVLPNLISPDENFRAVRGQVSYARRLTGGGLELRARVAGQYADGILYSGERFAAGGSQSVRGYRETLVLADTGVFGSLELAQTFSISGREGSRGEIDLGRFSVSGFVDAAYLSNREGAPAIPNDIASIGASLAWMPSSAINARITYGEALVSVPLTGSRDLQDRGVSFRITIRPLELLRR